jgi:hypothetical protein
MVESDLLLDRVGTSLVFAMGGAFGGVPRISSEAISLARLACEVGDDAEEAEVCRSVLALFEVLDKLGGPEEVQRGHPTLAALLLALCVARTPAVALPAPPEPVDVAERSA